jgi:hypothetical protein
MKQIFALFTLGMLLVSSACKHDPTKPDSSCIAGHGGRVTIVVYANYGTTPLLNSVTHPDTAFIKFGTSEFPGKEPSFYDTAFIGEPGEDHIHCMGLKCGSYYIFRSAWDSAANISRYGGSGISFSDISGVKNLLIHVN